MGRGKGKRCVSCPHIAAGINGAGSTAAPLINQNNLAEIRIEK
jgi:hypothetical protein